MPADPELLENRVSGLVTFPTLGLVALEFQTWQGGNVAVADKIRDRGVGESRSHAVPNLADVDDITVTRVYRTQRDDPVETLLRANVGLVYGQAAKVLRDLNQNKQVLRPFEVLLEGVSGPDGDTNGNGKGMLSLVLGIVSS